MKKAHFEELLESVREGGAILQGELAPSRVFVVELPETEGGRPGDADSEPRPDLNPIP